MIPNWMNFFVSDELRKSTNWTNQMGFTHQNFFFTFFSTLEGGSLQAGIVFLFLSWGQCQQVMSTLRYFEDVFLIKENIGDFPADCYVGFQGCFCQVVVGAHCLL